MYEYSVDTGLLRGLRELEKQAAIEMGQWTEKSHVKMDANVNQNSQILAATFTIEELERMANAGVKAAEQQQQKQQQQQPVTIAALSSGEDGGMAPNAEVLDEGGRNRMSGGTGHQSGRSGVDEIACSATKSQRASSEAR